MIAQFKDRTTQDIFDGANTTAARRIPQAIWKVARRKLDMLNAARDLRDLLSPPGNRLEGLKGALAGRHSIRVNDQFRIVFRLEGGTATEVRIVDYHSGGPA